MRIVIISDHLEYQRKTPSIKWVYRVLKSNHRHSVLYISTGLSILRLLLRRVGFQDFFYNMRFSQHSQPTFLFPIYPILNPLTRKYFEIVWSRRFVQKVVDLQADLIIVESGIPSIVLYSVFHNAKLKHIKKIYRVSDVIGSFRRNPVLNEIDRYIVDNKKYNNCIISSPAYHSTIIPDQILTPGVPSFALGGATNSKEKIIIYIGIYPLPEWFIDKLSRCYPKYKIICTSDGRPAWKNVEFVGILGQKDLQKLALRASIGVMFFPSGVSDWFLSSSNKLALYNALKIPVISNDCSVNLKDYCIYNVGEKFDKKNICNKRRVYSWEQFTEKLVGS